MYPQDTPVLQDAEFRALRGLIERETGIALQDGRHPLIVSRLGTRLRALGLQSFGEYYRFLTERDDGTELVSMLDLISTNTTSFFREPAHFEFLRNFVVPAARDRRSLRIWSAGCSSGEEPYSIAMTLAQTVPPSAEWDMRILASDLCTRVLLKARAGSYAAERLQSLPYEMRRYFFECTTEQEYSVKAEIRRMIQFCRINLMDVKYPIRSTLDVIFCRNTMIYFDRDTIATLLERFQKLLRPGGFLFVGHSESLQCHEDAFEYVQPTIYRRRST